MWACKGGKLTSGMASMRAFNEGVGVGSSRGDLAPGIRFGASDIENERERGEEADSKRVSIHTAFFRLRMAFASCMTAALTIICEWCT